MSGWPGQKVGAAPAAQPAPVAQPAQGGPSLRPVLTLPNPQQDFENQRNVNNDAQDAAKSTFRTMTPEEAQARGLPPGGVYQTNGLGEVKTIQAAPSTNPADATEGERKAAAFLLRALGANKSYEGTKVGPRGLVGQAMKNTFPDATNYFDSEERQVAEAAQDEFIAASLRQDSGAAIPEEELARQRRIYFPQPGDGPEAIEAKRQARLRAIAGLEQSAGRLLGPTQEEWARLSSAESGGQKQQKPFIPGIVEPETVGGIPRGSQVELGADQFGNDEISRGQNYFESQGIFANDQARITAFWNANRGNPQLTLENVKAWYAANGYQAAQLPDADLANAVEQAKRGDVEFIFDTSEIDDQYRDTLDAAIEAQGINPEDLGRSAVAGASSGATLGWNDEMLGALAAADEALKGGDIIGAYEANRDLRRRILERAREANPGTTFAAELAGGFAIPVAGSGKAVAKGGQAAVKQAAKTGAVVGGVAGAGYGEGASGTALGAGTGVVLGGALGGQTEKFLRGRRLAKINRSRNNPPPSGGGGGGAAGSTFNENLALGDQFGVTLSPGDAGGRGLKVVERILDNQPGSAGVMNTARNRLQGELTEATDNVAGQFGPTTSFRDLGEAGQAGVKSWRDRFNDVASKAYDAIPISAEAQATITGTVRALDELTTKITSNPKLAAMLEDKRLVGYLEALRGKARQVNTGLLDEAGNPIMREVTEGGALSWNDLKQLRSRIGEEIGEQMIGEGTMKSDLRRLYAALSADMEATARAQGPAALKRFERANDLYKAGQDRLERVWKSLLGPDGQRTPEAAAAVIQRISREGKSSGDLRMLEELRKSTVKSGEWARISNGIIRLLGRPANSEGREFSAQTFFRSYGDMSPEAKNLLFGGVNKELRQHLDEFAKLVGTVARNDGTRNTSNTGMTMSGLVGLGAGGIPGLLLQSVTSFGVAKAWTNPAFVRWASGYGRMIAGASRNGGQVSPKAHASQMQALSRVAAADASIAADALGLQQRLIAQYGQGAMPLAAQDENAGSNTTGSGTQ